MKKEYIDWNEVEGLSAEAKRFIYEKELEILEHQIKSTQSRIDYFKSKIGLRGLYDEDN